MTLDLNHDTHQVCDTQMWPQHDFNVTSNISWTSDTSLAIIPLVRTDTLGLWY